jgi:hypothetical protein
MGQGQSRQVQQASSRTPLSQPVLATVNAISVAVESASCSSTINTAVSPTPVQNDSVSGMKTSAQRLYSSQAGRHQATTNIMTTTLVIFGYSASATSCGSRLVGCSARNIRAYIANCNKTVCVYYDSNIPSMFLSLTLSCPNC